jgi:spermidine synthase/MFS family permease
MHQVVWAKLLVGLIGTTAHAQAAVLAVFMGGLALGSAFLGRVVDRRGRPLRTYVALEIGICVYCLALPLLLEAAGTAYVALATRFFASAGLTLLLRFALAFVVVLLPAVLMGGTLPVLARHLVLRVEDTQRRVGSLYALNSLGAVLGAGFAGFMTLPLLGIHFSLATASLLNLAAAALVLEPAREEARAGAAAVVAPVPRSRERAEPEAPGYRTEAFAVTLLALALSGFAAMGYELLFTRVIALSFGSSTYSFTVMLMAFVAGISLGSAIIARLRVRNPLWLLGVSQLLVVVALLAVTPLVSRLSYLVTLLRVGLHDAPLGFELYQLAKTALCLAVLLVPTCCLGFSFPLVARIQTRRSEEVGRRIGSTYAWNTAGNVLGAVMTSLLLLPYLGLLGAFHVNLGLSFVAGLAVLLVANEVAARRRAAAAAGAALVAVAYLATGTQWPDPLNLSRNHLRLPSAPASADDGADDPNASFAAWKRRFVAPLAEASAFHFEEDAHTTVLAYDDGKEVTLYVNTKPDASTRRDLATQLFLAHAPLFLAPESRTLLVIGHGSGITAGSALRHPIERADIVEISRGVLNADRLFADHNYHVLKDPRVRTHLDDAQSFLRTVPRTYDVIISEPSNPWLAGVGGLFTVEFFGLLQQKLNPGGVAAVWFHQYEQSNAAVELVLRTLASVFPHVVLCRSPDYADIIAVASKAPIEMDFAKMEDRFDQRAIRNDLARFGITNLASFLVHFPASEDRLRRLLAPGPLNTVGRQRLEYDAPRSFFRDEYSDFLEKIDPLYRGEKAAFLDGYAAWRSGSGEPVRHEELAYLASRSRRAIAAAIAARGQQTAEAPTRPARGLLLKPAEMGFFEALYWASRLQKERQTEAARYSRRALQLRPDAFR